MTGAADFLGAWRCGHNDPVLDVFYSSTRFPSPKRLDRLQAKGVPRRAVLHDGAAGVDGHQLGTARVVFDDRGDFAFAGGNETEAVGAFIIVARDAAGSPLDLIAWHVRTGDVGTYFGRAGVLGLQDYFAPQISGLPILHRDVLEWLRAERRGAVIVDKKRAGRILLDTPGRIAVADKAMSLEIAEVLLSTVDLSRIVIPTGAETPVGPSHG